MSRSLGGTVHIRFAPDRLPRSLAHLLVLSLVLTVLPVPRAEPRPEAVWVEDVGGSDALGPLYDQPPFPSEEPRAAEHADPPAAPAAEEAPRKLSSYTVQAGDTLSKIAARFKVSVETLVWANDLADPDLVVLGARLFIPPADGVLHRVRPGDTVADLVQFYGSDLQQTIQLNDLEAPFVILVGQRLLLPGGKMPVLARDPAPAVKPSNPPAPDAQTPRQDSGLAASIEAPVRAALPAPPNATPQQVAFILNAAEAARESQGKTGVPASVTIAQAILESYWGTSRLARENNNYFGIKARERPGTAGVVWYNVWEVIDGANVVQAEPFRAYKTAADSFVDHGWFFHNNGRYAGALAARGDPKQFAREINRAGYATDPAYAPKLIGLMDRFNLYAYDLK